MKSVSPEIKRPSIRKHWDPGVWPGVWRNGERAPPDGQRVSAVHWHEVGPHAAEELPLRLVHVDLDPRPLQELGHARDIEAEEMPADMVLMGMGDEGGA